MQTLALQLTATFVEDAIELVRGFGRVMVHLATAPVERIARACDVAGVLERRRAGRRALRHGRLSLFAGLSELT